MAKFISKATVEAITFDELVAIGREQNPGRVEMPWSFQYQGQPITHENDHCYLVPGIGGSGSQRFEQGDMLVTTSSGDLTVVKAGYFAAQYESEFIVQVGSDAIRGEAEEINKRLFVQRALDDLWAWVTKQPSGCQQVPMDLETRILAAQDVSAFRPLPDAAPEAAKPIRSPLREAYNAVIADAISHGGDDDDGTVRVSSDALTKLGEVINGITGWQLDGRGVATEQYTEGPPRKDAASLSLDTADPRAVLGARLVIITKEAVRTSQLSIVGIWDACDEFIKARSQGDRREHKLFREALEALWAWATLETTPYVSDDLAAKVRAALGEKPTYTDARQAFGEDRTTPAG